MHTTHKKNFPLFNQLYTPLYMIMIPAILYFIIFRYVRMGGLIMCFQDYRLTRGISESPWNGLDNFITLIHSPVFGSIFENTIVISLMKLVIAFPAPIIVALMLNSIARNGTKRVIQMGGEQWRIEMNEEYKARK